MVYVVSERPAAGLSGLMVDPGGLGSEDTAKSRLALYVITIHFHANTRHVLALLVHLNDSLLVDVGYCIG